MSLHVVALRGCAPTPLAHYLKALGLFRLVADQRDPGARAFWKDDVFHLASSLDAGALLDFVCDTFEPTPMVSPWNGGSGFYPKDNKSALDALVSAGAPRFARYAAAITKARALVGSREERPADDEKVAMLAECQRTWSEQAWLGATFSLKGDGTPRYPALLGTGGNDGHLDFTNNVMQRLVELVDLASGCARPEARELASNALFASNAKGLSSAAIGQFHPGAAGGANASAGFKADSLLNAWDFVLALEGALVLRVAALRRLDGAELPLAAAPFAVHGLAAGYGTATGADDEGRGELWLPLWNAATRYSELGRVFAEARFANGSERARGALDAGRAVATLGVSRGIASFERYGFMVRNGLANLAVPVGRIETQRTPNPGVRLLDELDGWMAALRRAARDDTAPPAFERATRRISALMFDIAIRGGESTSSFGLLLEELGATEELVVRSSKFSAKQRLRPLPLLSEAWASAANDGSAEFRLAAALASAGSAPRSRAGEELGPVRAHCLPLDATKRFKAFAGSDESLRDDPRVVWNGSDLVSNLCAVVLRRAMESGRAGIDGLAMSGIRAATFDDINAFLTGSLDERRLARLARGLMAVEHTPRDAYDPSHPTPLYALFRTANLDDGATTARAIPVGMSARCDTQTLRLLAAGRLSEAAECATGRLVAAGLRPKLRRAAGDARFARRLLASLAFPIDGAGVSRAVASITKTFALASTETP